MVNLREGITVDEAKKQVAAILDASIRCETSYFAPRGIVDDNSIYWLYCWAFNGGGSDKARDVARNVWNTIFDIPYNAFNEAVFHPIAEERREYKKE
jgi:hypothetical protein